MLIDILKAALFLGVVCLLIGVIIYLAGHLLHSKNDTKKTKILNILPGTNCGACGYAGCSDYAEAILRDGVSCDRCSVLGAAEAEEMAALTGTAQKSGRRMVAHIRCHGSNNFVNKKYIYYGMNDCAAANRLLGGYMKCQYGCLGFGNCVKKCPENAISIRNGVAYVHADLCNGCGQCLSACPKGVIELLPRDAAVFVSCSNQDPSARTIEACNIGCIGCKICEQTCPEDAVHVDGNVSVIDYEKCNGCGLCAEKCPRNLIELAVQKS